MSPTPALPSLKTPAEMETFIRANVRKEMADVAAANVSRAEEQCEAIRAKMKDPTDMVEFMRLAMDAQRSRAVVDETGAVVSDPYKGRGLGFARLARIAALSQQSRSSLQDAAMVLSRAAADGASAYKELADRLDAQQRIMSISDFAAGGALVAPETSSEVIELLYAQTVCLALGARTLDFNNSLDIGRINSGVTIGYIAEDGLMVPSQMGTGKLRLVGKKAYGVVGLTNELLRNPSVGADTILRDDLLQAMALRRDLSVLRGTGGEGQPLGIKNTIASGNKFNSTGTTIAQKVADLAKAMRLVDESNVPLTSGGWAMSPRSKWALFATLDGNSQFVFAQQLVMGMLFGFPAKTTTQIPNNVGGGTDSEVFFGAWNDLIIGFDKTTPLQVEFFPNGAWHNGTAVVSGISKDETPVRILEAHDALLRHTNTFTMIELVGWV